MNGILIGLGLCCFILAVATGVSSVVVLALANKKQWPQRPQRPLPELEELAKRLSWKLERDFNYFADRFVIADALLIIAEGTERATEIGQAYLNNEMPLITLVNHIAVLFVEVE